MNRGRPGRGSVGYRLTGPNRGDGKKSAPDLLGAFKQLVSELEIDHPEGRAPQGDPMAELRGWLSRKDAPPEESVTHDHITSMAPSIKAQLEQLKTLKRAGLYTEKEYEDKRRKILSGK